MTRETLIAAALLVAAASSPAFSWDITTVDGPGDVGAYASIALDPLGQPGISYCDAGNDDLKFARLAGGSWQVETVDATGRTGWYTSLAFDQAGFPRIAYWDLTNSALRYARWTVSAWTKETVDNAAYVGQCCSLALDGSGNPSISYYDYTNGDLKFARWDGSAWHIEVVDDGDPQLGAGLYTSLVLDSADHPHISYADHTHGQLRYAWWDGSSWTIEVVDGGTPIGTSIRLDAAGIPYVSYAYQFGQGSHLKLASRTGPNGTWQAQIVLHGGQVGWYSSLRLRPNGEPCIVSWDLGHGVVDYDSYQNGGWAHDTIETMGFTDQWCSLVLDGDLNPRAAYRSATNQDLHYAVGSLPSGVADSRPSTPARMALAVTPTPSRQGAVLRLQVAEASRVHLRIMDVLGRIAAPAEDLSLGRGSTEISLPAGLAPGVYFVRAETPSGDLATVRLIRTR